MNYLTDTDFSRLVLFARLIEMGLNPSRPQLQTDLAKGLLVDLENGKASPGNEAEFNRIHRLARAESTRGDK
jgi:hypothetical protein